MSAPVLKNTSLRLTPSTDYGDPAASAGALGTTVSPALTYGIVPAVGVSLRSAREDHLHGTPPLPTLAQIGAAAAVHDHGVLGDATGTLGALVVTGLRGRSLSVAVPNLNDALRWDGATWAPTPIVGVSDGDKVDITVSGGGTSWVVKGGAITYAKIQNVSVTDRLLGRATAGAGVIEEIPLTAAGRALLDDASTADQRTTLGLGAAALLAVPVPLVSGGTGATDAATARTNLGLGTAASPTFTGLTLSGLVSGRVPFASTGGLLIDSPNLLWNGTWFTATAVGSKDANGWVALNQNATSNRIDSVDPLWSTGRRLDIAAGAAAITLLTAGYVGINTDTPGFVLTAQGVKNTAIIAAQANCLDVGAGQFGPYTALRFRNYLLGDGTDSEIRSHGNLYVGYGTQLSFWTSTANAPGTLTERMRIDHAGNVGIGLTPAVPLHLLARYGIGVSGDCAFQITSGQSGGLGERAALYLQGLGTGGYAAVKLGCAAKASEWLVTAGNTIDGFEIRDTNHAATRLAIDNTTGNVGIGTTSPSAKLDVLKDTGRVDEAGYGIRVTTGAGDVALMLGTSTADGRSYIQSMDPGTAWDTRPLILNANGGSVGIGTGASTPTAGTLLDVNGVARATLWDTGGEVVNVLASGLDNTGTNDVTAGLQTILDAAYDGTPTHAKVIHMPRGRYKILTHVTIPFWVTLQGDPHGARGGGDHGTVLELFEGSGHAGTTDYVSTTALSTTVTSVNGKFVVGDVGQSIFIRGAGAGGADLRTTIAGYTNPTTATLTVAAGTTTSSVWGCWPLPAIMMLDLAMLRDVSIKYPSQVSTGTPNAYPFAIYMGGGCNVENVDLGNAYQGIDAGSGTAFNVLHGGNRIKNITGMPLSVGIEVDQSLDVTRIETIHFFPHYGGLAAWVEANGTVMRVGRSDWQMTNDVFAYGYNTGIKLFYSTRNLTAGNQGAACGHFYNINFDKVNVGIDADAAQFQGVFVHGMQWASFTTATLQHALLGRPTVGGAASSTAFVHIDGLCCNNGSGGTRACVDWQNGGLVTVKGSRFMVWGTSAGTAYAVDIATGRAIIQGNYFADSFPGNPWYPNSANGIRIQAGADRCLVQNNMLTGKTLTILNALTLNTDNQA